MPRGSAAACISCATSWPMPAAKTQWRQVADQLRPKVAKLAALMDAVEPDVLAYMSFPAAHRPKLHSTNPIERLNGEIERAMVSCFRNPSPLAVAVPTSD